MILEKLSLHCDAGPQSLLQNLKDGCVLQITMCTFQEGHVVLVFYPQWGLRQRSVPEHTNTQ